MAESFRTRLKTRVSRPVILEFRVLLTVSVENEKELIVSKMV